MSLSKVLKAAKVQGTMPPVGPHVDKYLIENPNLQISNETMEFVKDELTTPQRFRRMTVSASSLGACPRAQVFQFTAVKPMVTMDPDLHAIFHDGNFRHLRWQVVMLEAKLLTEVEVSCSIPDLNLTGTIDGVNTKYNFGWELKGCNTRTFSFVLRDGPLKKHLYQIHAYMIATHIRTWSLVYENKDTQEYKEFIIEFDQDIADEVLYELQAIKDHVDHNKLPPIKGECKQKKGEFRRCPFAHVCLDTEGWPQSRKLKRL